jgi:hypothetical protein
MPLCGYGGTMAAVCGHHHYLYAYDWHNNGYQNAILPEVLANNAFVFYNEIINSKKKND